MPQSVLETNIDGFRIIKLPLNLTSSRAGGIRVNKIYVKNMVETPDKYVFKIKELYSDYSNVSNIDFLAADAGFYQQIMLQHVNHSDFYVNNIFELHNDDDFDFSVTFEPLSNTPVTGYFNSELHIEWAGIASGGEGEVILNISGEWREQRGQIIDGVNTSDVNYVLKVHNSSYSNEFIRLG